MTESSDSEMNVYCYDPPQNNWTTLPPHSVRIFGLGQVIGKLVVVGGVRKGDFETISEVLHLMSNLENGNGQFHPCQQLEIPQVS